MEEAEAEVEDAAHFVCLRVPKNGGEAEGRGDGFIPFSFLTSIP